MNANTYANWKRSTFTTRSDLVRFLAKFGAISKSTESAFLLAQIRQHMARMTEYLNDMTGVMSRDRGLYISSGTYARLTKIADEDA